MTSTTVPVTPGYMVIIDQVPYQHPSKHTSPENLSFTTLDGRGVRLLDALHKRATGLDHKDDECFQGCGSLKMRTWIHVPGYEAFNQQKNIYRQQDGTNIRVSREVVARQIAQVVLAFIRSTEQLVVYDHRVRFGPDGVDFSHLYLLGLIKTGSTVQPVLGYYVL